MEKTIKYVMKLRTAVFGIFISRNHPAFDIDNLLLYSILNVIVKVNKIYGIIWKKLE